ncbi:MAG: (4Fe-4S)-binding protein [Acidobacteria bacterium]|nr:(4Fe-4S)-binding protein [Acidobacteriota bacterium]
MKRVQSYTAPGIRVTFDPNVCIHSAVCLKSLPAVFDVRRRRWVQPEAASEAEVAAAIDRCPSGALKYVLAGRAEPTTEQPGGESKATIRTSTNGPLLVEGAFELLDESGSRIVSIGRAALCRCGATAKQPFCDGSHQRVGFRSKKSPAA